MSSKETCHEQNEEQRGIHTGRQLPLSQLPLWSPQVGGVLPVPSSVWQRGAQKLLETTHLNKEISFVAPVQAYTCRLHYVLAKYQAVSMCECVCSGGLEVKLHLGLQGVVWVVSVVVFTWHCGLYAGRFEEEAQLLLLALSQAMNDTARLLLLLWACTHTRTQQQSVSSTHANSDVENTCEFNRKSEVWLCVFCWETNRPDSFEAFLEPHAYGLLGDLLFNGVLQLFPRQQLLQLERLSNVHWAIGQHAVWWYTHTHIYIQQTAYARTHTHTHTQERDKIRGFEIPTT